jgi:hypothetical protein
MSSNFTVNRLCEQCGNVFVAKTTVTRFCSKLCNKRHYKAKERSQKMTPMDQAIKKVFEGKTEEVSDAEFLNVRNAARLLRASEKMVYHLINIGRLHAINLSERKTLVRRSDIDKIFELPAVEVKEIKPPPISECYHMAEAQEIFKISESALFNLIKRYKLFKFQEGWYTYVAKADLNKIFNPEL